MTDATIEENLQKKYQEWRIYYQYYKDLMNSQEVEIGNYSISVQQLFYSMNNTIKFIQDYKLEEECNQILADFDACIMSIRPHLLNLEKMLRHPYDIETFLYLKSLLKRLPLETATLTDEEVLLIYQEMLKEAKRNSPIN